MNSPAEGTSEEGNMLSVITALKNKESDEGLVFFIQGLWVRNQMHCSNVRGTM